LSGAVEAAMTFTGASMTTVLAEVAAVAGGRTDDSRIRDEEAPDAAPATEAP
jgi:hypothetical protein